MRVASVSVGLRTWYRPITVVLISP